MGRSGCNRGGIGARTVNHAPAGMTPKEWWCVMGADETVKVLEGGRVVTKDRETATPLETSLAVMRGQLDKVITEDVPPGTKFRLDLEDKSTPPLLKLLAAYVRNSPPWALLDESVRQWPLEYNNPDYFSALLANTPWWKNVAEGQLGDLGEDPPLGWVEQWSIISRVHPLVEKAKEHLVAMTIGVALGVTEPNHPPELVALVEAVKADARIKRALEKKERDEKQAAALEKKTARARSAARKAERAARKRARR